LRHVLSKEWTLSKEQTNLDIQNRDHPLSPFAARWLAEAMRVREQRGDLDDDGAAGAEARRAGVDVEARILIRAQHLASRDGTLEAMSRWHSTARWLLFAFAALALVLGFSAALTMVGDGTRSVNIVWTLGALLGLHLLMLLLWLLNMLMRGQSAGGVLGRLWLALMSRVGGSRHGALTQGLMAVSLRGRLLHWYPSAITHGLWFLSLTAAALAVVLALALRSYDFVWETTILSEQVFVRFVQWSGALPAMLGFVVPDADMVAVSGNGDIATAAEREFMRRAWSSWLLGSLLVYGMLPRLLLLGLSVMLLRWRQKRLSLDLTSPHWAPLAARLSPVSERGGVTDPQPDSLVAPTLKRDPSCSGEPVMLAMELRPDSDWPPSTVAPNVRVPSAVDSGRQRADALIEMRQLRPARLLLVCDARLSPDRGTLHWLVQASAFCADSRVWLLHQEQAPDVRRQSWQEALGDTGFTDTEIILDKDHALVWIAGDSGERANG